MFGLRFVSLAVATLLFGNAVAAPAPAPVYYPHYGEIIHVAPDQTTGGSYGTGISTPHPHIALGHDPHGNVIVAPVTHNSQSDHLKPHMPTPAEHGLGGVTRLDHIVANPGAVQQSYGALRGKVMSPGATDRIQQGKGLVQAHYAAADAHGLAAQAHRDSESYHNHQSAQHFQTGNAPLGAHHASQATFYREHAEAHEASAGHHNTAAKAVNGPNHAELQHAQNSAHFAHGVHSEFSAAAQHHQNAAGFHAVGNHVTAQHASNAATTAHNNAINNSHTAVHHANQATAHVQH
jgi:hypothetical protein